MIGRGTGAGPQLFDQTWRARAILLISSLERTHGIVHALGEALGRSPKDEVAVRRLRAVIDDEIASLGTYMKETHPYRAGRDEVTDVAKTGSALAVAAIETATLALNTLVAAMTALSVTNDDLDTETLIGACIDGERAYEESIAMARATSQSDRWGIEDLRCAFFTSGEIALRKRLREKNSNVQAISERVRRQQGFRLARR